MIIEIGQEDSLVVAFKNKLEAIKNKKSNNNSNNNNLLSTTSTTTMTSIPTPTSSKVEKLVNRSIQCTRCGERYFFLFFIHGLIIFY